MAKTPTLADLNKQKTAIEQAIAAAEYGPARSALALLQSDDTGALQVSIEKLIEQLPEGQIKEQLGHVVTVLTQVPTFLDIEVKRLAALLEPAGVV